MNASRSVSAQPRIGATLKVQDIEVAQDKKTLWLAAPTVALKKGGVIRFEDGAEITNFHSKTLDRTFARIMFISHVLVTGEKE